jgi:hypothetical protein
MMMELMDNVINIIGLETEDFDRYFRGVKHTLLPAKFTS